MISKNHSNCLILKKGNKWVKCQQKVSFSKVPQADHVSDKIFLSQINKYEYLGMKYDHETEIDLGVRMKDIRSLINKLDIQKLNLVWTYNHY